MVSENPWFLITEHEIDEIQGRVHCLEGELPCTGLRQAREIIAILKVVRDRWP